MSEQIAISLLDQTINGLVLANLYALVAIGLALIFGVANVLNFAHGSVYMAGAYVGWLAITRWHLPLIVAFGLVAIFCAGLGIGIERIGLRALYNSARIAPLLATLGISADFTCFSVAGSLCCDRHFRHW